MIIILITTRAKGVNFQINQYNYYYIDNDIDNL